MSRRALDSEFGEDIRAIYELLGDRPANEIYAVLTTCIVAMSERLSDSGHASIALQNVLITSQMIKVLESAVRLSISEGDGA